MLEWFSEKGREKTCSRASSGRWEQSPLYEISQCFIYINDLSEICLFSWNLVSAQPLENWLWHLHNLIGTEKCSPWSCKRCCQLDYSILGLGSPGNQRLLHVERILTSLHCSSTMLCQLQGLAISVILNVGRSNSSSAAAVLLECWKLNCTALVQEGSSPALSRRSHLSLCISNLHLHFSCWNDRVRRNKSKHKTPGTRHLENPVWVNTMVQGM